MTVENLLLLIAGLVNLMMFFVVISRGFNNKINLYFGLLTFFNFLWAGSLFLSRMPLDSWLFWARVTYVWALGIAISLFYFTYYYPIITYKLNKYFHIFNLLIIFCFSFIILFGGIFFIHFERGLNNTYPYLLLYNNASYILYSFYFIFLSVISLLNLSKKFSILNLVYRSQVVIIAITLLVGLIFGAYFDLVICYFGNFRFNWLGPIFTLFINMVVFRSIIASKEKISN